MKISPVIGTPTLPLMPQSGNSPEKLARLKQIAAGETPIAVSGSDVNVEQPQPAQRTIVMKTNHTTNRHDRVYEQGTELGTPVALARAAAADLIKEPGSLQQNSNSVAEEPETVNSDNSVQANAVREVTQPLSPQSVALAKQRRALQLKEQAITEREAALAGPTRSELESRIKSQPLSVLQELGVTYDQLTNDILAAQSGVTPELLALKAEVKALKEGVDKTFSDKDQAAEKAVLSEIRRTVNQLSSQGDDFEMIRETRSQPDVMDLIYRTWKQSGEVLDEVEAMRLVEGELEKDAERIARLKKIQRRITPPIESALQLQQPTKGMRTLTNKDSATPSMSRRQRAILAAQGNLKR